MAEYLEKEDFKSWMKENITENPVILKSIDYAPAADVALVRHGRWLEVREKRLFGEHYFLCSNCKSINGLMIPFNYCPNCGAEMDKENGE